MEPISARGYRLLLAQEFTQCSRQIADASQMPAYQLLSGQGCPPGKHISHDRAQIFFDSRLKDLAHVKQSICQFRITADDDFIERGHLAGSNAGDELGHYVENDRSLRIFGGKGYLRSLPLAGGWTEHRDFPSPQGETFQSLWKKRNAKP